MQISAVVLTKNEERALAHCLKMLTWCDEVIVVDNDSTDKTVKIAKKHGAGVYRRHMDGDFAAQRNFGLARARSDWVLFVDADERVSRDLRKEILSVIGDEQYAGFEIPRKEVWMGKTLFRGEWGQVRLLRLGRKDAGEWRRSVHEKWDIEGKVGKLQNYLTHEVEIGLAGRLAKINVYSAVHAYELEMEGKTVGFWRVFVMPAAKFGVNYVVKRGYQDGARGFILSVVMSFHSFLAWSDLCLKKK